MLTFNYFFHMEGFDPAIPRIWFLSNHHKTSKCQADYLFLILNYHFLFASIWLNVHEEICTIIRTVKICWFHESGGNSRRFTGSVCAQWCLSRVQVQQHIVLENGLGLNIIGTSTRMGIYSFINYQLWSFKINFNSLRNK